MTATSTQRTAHRNGHPHRAGRIPIVFAMTGAYGLCGGIATANKNILYTLVEFAERHGRGLVVLSLHEDRTHRPEHLPRWAEFHPFRGNKLAFATALLRRSTPRTAVVFDHVTLALPAIPLAATGLLKTIIFAHGSEAWKRVRRTSRLSFRFATVTLTNSRFTLEHMRAKLSSFRGETCLLGLSPEFKLDPGPSATDTLSMKSADGIERRLGKRVLLLVARIDPREGQKGHDVLVTALPALRSEFPEVQLVMAGPGSGREAILRLAHQEQVADIVFVPGLVSSEILQRLYRASYAFVMPSRQEGFGLVHLEAMSYAKPCVGCVNDGAADVIVHGETGWLIEDPNNESDVLSVLRELLSDPHRARTLGYNGLNRLRANFTAQQHQRRIMSCLERAILE